MSSVGALIQYNLNEVMTVIKAEKATGMKDITHHAHDATMGFLCNSQPSARSDQHIVSQRVQKQQHVLSFKAFLMAFGQTQSTLVTFQGDFLCQVLKAQQ